ncbi:hypothetical protein PUN4_280287 [Paraburkholderia unamae]|nr:hypothetical protein PUN4_280287 [Paraburkholderia unamae]
MVIVERLGQGKWAFSMRAAVFGHEVPFIWHADPSFRYRLRPWKQPVNPPI